MGEHVEGSLPIDGSYEPRYHDTDSAYVIGNDEPEHERLETQSRHLANIMNGEIVHAPIKEPGTVQAAADIGCGTGIATESLGNKFPNAQCWGVDISPVPSNLRNQLSNVHFVQANILHGVEKLQQATEVQDGFDLIFSRLLVFGMSDWPKYMQVVYDSLRPTAWAEMHELVWIFYDRDGNRISDDWDWLRKFRIAMAEKGMDFECGIHFKSRMMDAGFVDIQRWEYQWVYGPEPGMTPAQQGFAQYVGRVIPELYHHSIAKIMPKSKLLSGLSPERREVVIKKMQGDLAKNLSPGKGWFQKYYVAVGRKPEDADLR